MADHREHPCCPPCTAAGRTGLAAARWHDDRKEHRGDLYALAGWILIGGLLALAVWAAAIKVLGS